MTTAPAHPAPPAIDEPQVPYPPRFRWLKRGGLFFLLFVLAMLALRLWWGHVADRRLADLIAYAHAHGQPILREDLEAAPVPPGQNAALSLDAAAKSFVPNLQFDALESRPVDTPLNPLEVETIGQTLAMNQKPLELYHLARSERGIDWQIHLTAPWFLGQGLGHLNDQRALCRRIFWAVQYHHTIGADAQAVEEIRDMLRQADAVSSSYPIVIVQMVGQGITGEATSLVERTAFHLQTVDHSPPSTRFAPASREQVEALIAELLDETETRHSETRMWYGEGAADLDTVHYMRNPFGSRHWTAWPFEPMFDLDGLAIYRSDSRAADATTAPNWPAAEATIPDQSGDRQSPMEFATQIYSRILGTSSARVANLFYHVVTERRAAAVMLSVRLYRLDHDGHLPATLQELAPRYLPAVPIDPMAADGRQFAYRPERVPQIIYSVGDNGKDDGGAYPPGNLNRWRSADAVFELEPEPTPPSPDTQNDK
jgi:hypothetical protein